jgi:hypothetical protein
MARPRTWKQHLAEEDTKGAAADPGELARQVPEKLRARFTEIVTALDRFCDRHLDEEFKQLCRSMAVVACQEGLPLANGKAAGWAAGIVYSVGWVNFLGDPGQPHHMKAEDMARALGVSPATLMNRARVLREELGPRRMDPWWSTKGMMGNNPLVWMVEINGLPYDIRRAPRQVQEELYRRGLIPFVPGEEDPAET